MKNFATVQAHFRKLHCSHCEAAFTPEGVKLLREEQDYWVVRVHCTACDQPSGVAVVGVEFEGAPAESEARNAPIPINRNAKRAIFSSRHEEQKFQAMAPISDDDMLDAHAFFQGLDADWNKYLPRA